MGEINRPHKMTVRLSDEELAIREALELDTGGDGNTVMRQGMIDLAKLRGIKPPQKKEAVPEGTARRKR